MLPDQGGRRAGLQELRYRDEEAVPLQGRDQLRHPQAAGNDDDDVNDDDNDDDVGARGDAQAQDQVVEAEGRQELQGTYSILYVCLSIHFHQMLHHTKLFNHFENQFLAAKAESM